MPKIRPLDRILVLLAVLLACYQVVVGIEGLGTFAIAAYTVGFGALLIAGLLVIILGFEILDSPHIAIVSTVIPLSLSAGLVSEFFPAVQTPYLVFALVALGAVIFTRYRLAGNAALIALVFTHAVSGLIIFILPVVVSLTGRTPLLFGMVGVGGALIGIFGLLLSFLKAERPLLSEEQLWGWFPALILVVTSAFVLGFAVV